MTFGSLGATSMSSMRPPMLAGPIDRKRKLESKGFDDRLNAGSRAAAPRPCAHSGAATSGNTRTGMTRRKTFVMMTIRWGNQRARSHRSEQKYEPYGDWMRVTDASAKYAQRCRQPLRKKRAVAAH